MARAMVLSGGGSRGSYQIGAWQAVRECGISVDMAFGTSIGAINAALVAQDSFPQADKLWRNLDLSQIFADERAKDLAVETMIRRKRDILPFLMEHSHAINLDISPLEKLLKGILSESRLRVSGRRFGITTAKVPTLAPVRVYLEDMKPGTIVDWILASCACFPVVPLRRIDGDSYLDGGVADNMPYAMALLAGAEEIIGVDVHPRPEHPEYNHLPNLVNIRPRAPLSGFLDFHPAVQERIRRLGYHDGMKALGRFEGFGYTFLKTGAIRPETAPKAFLARAEAWDALSRGGLSIPSLLREEEPGRPLTYREVRIRSLELAMECLEYRRDGLYHPEELTEFFLGFVRGSVPPPCEEAAHLRGIYQGLRENGTSSVPKDAICHPKAAGAALFLHCLE